MDDNKHNDQFSASLPLPDEAKPKNDTSNSAGNDAAAELIRKRVNAAYKHEPDLEDETEELEAAGPKHHSKHQEFIFELTNSGRPLHEIQTAWHEYYAGLTDKDKHQIWQDFYNTQAQQAQHPAVTHQESAHIQTKPAIPHRSKQRAKIAEKVERVKQEVRPRDDTAHQPVHRSAARQGIHSLLFGLGTGSIVILIFMFTFFNDRIIAPFIQPSRNATNIPLISSGSVVGPEPEVIIPKINSEIPVVYDVSSTEDAAIQQGLTEGVVHYPTTPSPGQTGNVVIVGHSSGNIFNQGNYKFAFSLLRAVDTGDTFYLQKDGKRFTYQVYEKKVVKPTDVSVLGTADKPDTATLITCDPPGLNANRLVLVAEQIDPAPTANVASEVPQNIVPASTTVIPGNSLSLWARMVNWFEN